MIKSTEVSDLNHSATGAAYIIILHLDCEYRSFEHTQANLHYYKHFYILYICLSKHLGKWYVFTYYQENMSVKCVPPQTPLLYSKTGVCRGMPFFLFLLQNRDCGYSLEPKIFNFYNLRKICILHGRVFVILSIYYETCQHFHIVPGIPIDEPSHWKPTICKCENKGADQLRGNREADQRLCFRYTDSTIPLLSKSKISSL